MVEKDLMQFDRWRGTMRLITFAGWLGRAATVPNAWEISYVVRSTNNDSGLRST